MSSDHGESAAGRPGIVKLWFLAIRPQTLPASLSPVAVGSAMAYSDGYREAVLEHAMIFWLFALFIQIGTNLHNDYADFVKGADTHERLGQARVTQKGWLQPSEVAVGATVALTCAALVGTRLIFVGGLPFVGIVVTSLFNAVAYTGGPYPLGYIGLGDFSIGYLGLGDIFVLAYFGFVAVCGTFYLCSYPVLELPWHAVWAAVPTGFLATAIIVVNNLRDRKTDVKAGKLTLAVRFGATFARTEYTLLVVGSFVALLWGVRFGKSPLNSVWWGLPWLSLPMGISRIQAIWDLDGKDLNPLLGGTAFIQLLFCALFVAASLLSAEEPSSKS